MNTFTSKNLCSAREISKFVARNKKEFKKMNARQIRMQNILHYNKVPQEVCAKVQTKNLHLSHRTR